MKFEENINPVVSVTVTHENCDNIKDIFNHLFYKCKIDSLKCTVVRDEGVLKTPEQKRKKIFEAYKWLSEKIFSLAKTGEIKNYNTKSIQGRLHNKKDEISQIIYESADLIYHLLVLWKKFDLTPDQIYTELENREGKTGLRK